MKDDIFDESEIMGIMMIMMMLMMYSMLNIFSSRQQPQSYRVTWNEDYLPTEIIVNQGDLE